MFKNLQPVWGVLIIASVLIEFLFLAPREAEVAHAAPWWHTVVGSHALLGFVFCVVLVALAKGLAAAGLERPEEKNAE